MSIRGNYTELAYHHSKIPMLRIGQLWSDFFEWVKTDAGRDPYYLSDQHLMELFSQYCNMMERKAGFGGK